MRLLLAAVLLGLSVAASRAEVVVGQPFPPYALADAFGVTNALATNTRVVIVASEKGISGKVHDWLMSKEKGFLEAHRAEYVSDITPMPDIITKMFALPKMKKYPYRILLADDPSFAKIYPHQPDKIAAFVLDDSQKVVSIHFLGKADELDPIVAPAPAEQP